MTAPLVIAIDTVNIDHDIGSIPDFLDTDDPRPAKEQFAERYKWGGWRNQPGFVAVKVLPYALAFPGDPIMMPIAIMVLRDEEICIYPHAYVAIWQKDGTFEACRMD